MFAVRNILYSIATVRHHAIERKLPVEALEGQAGSGVEVDTFPIHPFGCPAPAAGTIIPDNVTAILHRAIISGRRFGHTSV
jgi:hypothetical protein